MPQMDSRPFGRLASPLIHANGMYYYTPEGRAILDGTSGLWCTNAGHCRQTIVAAIRKAAHMMDTTPDFNPLQSGTLRLANRLASQLPPNLSRVFFVNARSEAMDCALALTAAYHRAKGEPSRTRIVGSAPGLPSDSPHASALEETIAARGAETIAAVIVAPLAKSGGLAVPPLGYLENLREITCRHGILLIFDETITAFGRLGVATASQRFSVTPDIIVVGEGLTNGAVPIGAAIIDCRIHDAALEAGDAMPSAGEGAQPIAVAAGLATLELYQDEGLFQRAAELEPYWNDALCSLAGAPLVHDIHSLGLAGGIELVPRRQAPGARASDVFRFCFESGLLSQAQDDTILLSPPLIVSKNQIDETVEKLSAALRKVK